jgi:hypothetical protein
VRGQGIFISYRRDDSQGDSGRLDDHLRRRYGERLVFRDVRDSPPGVSFPDHLRYRVTSCRVAIVVIGLKWLPLLEARLNRSDDWLRFEIATALQSSDVRVLPVLVQGATMPREEDLPYDLRELSTITAHELSDSRWNYDFGVLVALLDPLVRSNARSVWRRTAWLGALGVAVLLAAAVIGRLAVVGLTRVSVSNVNGQSTASAQQSLQAAGLTPTVTTTPNCGVEQGHVISTEPGAGAQLARGSTVRLTVSSSNSVVVPSVVHVAARDAEKQLTGLGLTPGTTVEDNGSVPPGQVSLTDPPAGRRICTGSSVRLVVSRGVPADAVKGYFTAINAKDYPTAYSYWGASWQSRQGFAPFQTGMADTETDEVLEISDRGAGPNSTIQFFVRFLAHHVNGTTTSYSGTYFVGLEGSRWVLIDAHIS